MNIEKDKYDLAIDYLTEHPEEIYQAWDECEEHEAGCLFQRCTRNIESPWSETDKNGRYYGCLTQIRDTIRSSYYNKVAETEELTKAIQLDERIPYSWREITEENLPVFAEWQRRIDRELVVDSVQN